MDTESHEAISIITGTNARKNYFDGNAVRGWILGLMVGRHDRVFGRREESLDLQHYLPILAQKGCAIRYARPVQKAVPAQFIDWLESQHLSSKEMVELLSQCLDAGYIAVMAGTASSRNQSIVEDTVPVRTVQLEAYDALCGKGGSVS